MSIFWKPISILLLLLLISVSSYSQISSSNPVNKNIQARFLKEKIETGANTTVFNLLTIRNNSIRSFDGTVRFSVPDNWGFFGEKSLSVSIPEGDSVVIPVRIAVANNVLGEIGYAVFASVVDRYEKQIVTSYCFIAIPRASNLKVKVKNKVTYFDTKTKEATIDYRIINNGNVNEVVHLELDGKNELKINNQVDAGAYTKEVSVSAHTDTTVKFTVNYINNDDLKNNYFLNIKYLGQDTSYFNTVWLNRVDEMYDYEIPEYYKCAILQVVINNILQKSPTFSFVAKGNILFKKNASIYYFLRPPSWNPQKDITDLYNSTNAMYYIGYRNRKMDLRIGNLNNKLRQRFYGIGASLDYTIKNIQLGGFYMQNQFTDAEFYGGELNFYAKSNINTGIGYAQMNLIDILQYIQIGTLKSSFSLGQHNKFKLEAGVSVRDHQMYTPYTSIGYGFNFKYGGNFNKLRIRISSDYGSPEYTGVSRGRLYVNGNLRYSLNNSSNLNFTYLKRDYSPAFYINDVLQTIRFFHYDDFTLEHAVNVNQYTGLYYGGNFIMEKTNQLRTPGSGNYSDFYTQNYRGFLKARVSIPYTQIILSPQLDIGIVEVKDAENLINATDPSYLTYNFYFNLTAKKTGLLFLYRDGPFHAYEQFYYYYGNYFSKRLSIIGYYNQFLLEDLLKMTLRANYQSDIISSNNNFTLTTQFDWYLPKDWSLYLLNSFSIRSLKDSRTGSILKYNTNYMEVGIRKEINCKQPRIQFYNLKVVFFRDINGNRKMEKNEPGVGGVLAKIKPSSDKTNEGSSEFVMKDLMSGPSGMIEYNNIPNGDYMLYYTLLGSIIGNFSREEMEKSFQMDKDEVLYIPYLENNKIIGKVVMNRDPLSSYGDLDLSNIRISATDTKGHTYSALTDKQGNFILYAPVTDHYVVKINNVFYESFDLQQPEFIVKFNGYKQFEVTFVFNEKKRKINFDNELEVEDLKLEDIKVIRKTTLNGKVRDAISLEPVEAEIKIIDNKTNKVVSRAISNKKNGNYNISYAAGTHFRIEVVAKGYWEKVENLYIEQVISIQNINKDIMLDKEGTNRAEEQKTFIIYNKKEEEFKENFKQGQLIPINYLNFASKETRLDPKSKPELDRLLDLLNKNKSVNIEVAGYSDDGGNARVEKMMAMRRAKEVEKYLTMHGLSESRITVKSYGNTRPLVPGSSEKAKAKNRRVEIIVR